MNKLKSHHKMAILLSKRGSADLWWGANGAKLSTMEERLNTNSEFHLNDWKALKGWWHDRHHLCKEMYLLFQVMSLSELNERSFNLKRLTVFLHKCRLTTMFSTSSLYPWVSDTWYFIFMQLYWFMSGMMAFRLFMPTIFIPPNRCCIYYVKTTHIRSISIFPKAFTMSVWISVKAPGNFKRFRLCSLKMKILVLGQYLPRENILCCTILEWSPAASSRTEIIWKV